MEMFTITNILAFVGIIAIVYAVYRLGNNFYNWIRKVYYNVMYVDTIINNRMFENIEFPFSDRAFNITNKNFYSDVNNARSVLVRIAISVVN